MGNVLHTVTQADRNAAVRLLEAGGQDWQAKEIRLGQGDHFPIVQAFAAHRIEAREQALEEAAKLCDDMGADEQEGFGLDRATQNYFRARNAIRALKEGRDHG